MVKAFILSFPCQNVSSQPPVHPPLCYSTLFLLILAASGLDATQGGQRRQDSASLPTNVAGSQVVTYVFYVCSPNPQLGQH